MSNTVQSFFDSQLISEVKPMTTDFTDFIRDGASISSVAASYAQTFAPGGGSLASGGSCAVGASEGSVTHTSPALSAAGGYRFVVTATMSDGDVRKALWYVRIDA